MIVPAHERAPEPDEQRAEQLYRLLPAIYRLRDERLAPLARGAEQRRGPLFELLRAIAAGADALEADIARLYQDAFIETCADWVVPYIADLVGYRAIDEAGAPGDPATAVGTALNKALTSRREVANTIYLRRRKGALHLLEQLAGAVAGWPARAVEGFDRVALAGGAARHPGARGTLPRVSDPRAPRAAPGRSAGDGHGGDPRDALDRLGGPFDGHGGGPRDALDRLGGPFDGLPRAADVRLPAAGDRVGRPALRTVTLYAWTTRAWPVTFAQPHRRGPGCFTFDPSGADLPLYINPAPEPRPAAIAGELNLPARLRTQALVDHKGSLYGPGLSLCVYKIDGAGGFEPVPAEQIVAADLPDEGGGGWACRPRAGEGEAGADRSSGVRIAIDPERGRLMALDGSRELRVSYHYGFSAEIGAGEYVQMGDAGDTPGKAPRSRPVEPVRRLSSFGPPAELRDALVTAASTGGTVELIDSGNYRLDHHLTLNIVERTRLHVCAGQFARPVLTVAGQRGGGSIKLVGAADSEIVLEGLLLTPESIEVTGRPRSITLRNCTLVAGAGHWLRLRPSSAARVELTIERSIICGPAPWCPAAPAGGQVAVAVRQSILLGASDAQDLIGVQGDLAPIALAVDASTVFGALHVRSLKASNSIFAGPVEVDRDAGSKARHCYLANDPGEDAQPADGIERLNCPSHLERPRFVATTYGDPQLCRLRRDCPEAIRRGADDGGELGAYHHLYLPQREAVLRARLEEYSVAALDPQLIIVE